MLVVVVRPKAKALGYWKQRQIHRSGFQPSGALVYEVNMWGLEQHSNSGGPMPHFLKAALVFAVAVNSFGQNIRSASYQTGKSQQAKPPLTLHTSTKLVLVDVVILDKNKRPVHGLMAQDFRLQENETQQTINGFEEHTAPTAADLAKLPAATKLPPGTFLPALRGNTLRSGPTSIFCYWTG